ncbi:hypothetical protein B0H34DRAFT_651790 [Crassisporium funariophilum]|nr:hypothetical protein B0H34DRAFT_651790 [Crassisporium funariophilum]
MLLLLSSDSLLSEHVGTFKSEEGQVVYDVVSPWKLKGKTTTIYRHQHVNDTVTQGSTYRRVSMEKARPQDMPSIKEESTKVAEIEFHTYRPSRIRFGGQDLSEHEIFASRGRIVDHIRTERVFHGTDGKEYVWTMQERTKLSLSLNNDDRTPIAIFHPRGPGILRAESQPVFEVYPEGEHMLDLILVTFIFVQSLRKEHRTRATALI